MAISPLDLLSIARTILNCHSLLPHGMFDSWLNFYMRHLFCVKFYRLWFKQLTLDFLYKFLCSW
jgi:hypothetical protein